MLKVLVIHWSQSNRCKVLFWRFSPHCEVHFSVDEVVYNSPGWLLFSLLSLTGTVWLRLLLLFEIRLVHTFSDVSRSDKQDPPERRPLCGWTMLERHRMELSGGRVLGLQPASRKSWTAVHCRSKWPLRVQRDGQFRAAAHTASLCWGSWTFSLTQCHTH